MFTVSFQDMTEFMQVGDQLIQISMRDGNQISTHFVKKIDIKHELHNKPYKLNTADKVNPIQPDKKENECAEYSTQSKVIHDHSEIIYQNIVRKSKSLKEEVSETNKKETPSKCENHLVKEKDKKESKTTCCS